MSQSIKKKLVVCGGNGFLGSRICKSAVQRGWEVVSISRSGEPFWSGVSSSAEPPPWSKSVSWQKANIFQPKTYQLLLKDADAVVHSMGILLEADYKKILQGKESIVSGLQRAFAPRSGDSNPLERKLGDEVAAPKSADDLTYEMMNRDSATTLAQEASAAGASSFAYISAAAGFLILPARYITTKREAESIISTSFPKMRSLFFRPGFLYDSSRTFTLPMAALGSVSALVNSTLGGRLTWLMGAGGTKPLKADVVAEAVVEALGDDAVKGVIETKDIEDLASKAWRKGML